MIWLGIALAADPAPAAQPTAPAGALAQPTADDGLDDPRRLEQAVTRARGRRGGITVFWPRVLPATGDPEVQAVAAALQARLVKTAERASPIAPRDLRPEPERVCPRERGCRSASISALVAHQDGGCVAVALIGPPGVNPIGLVPLAGQVELVDRTVPFRAPPESVVTVREFVPCSALLDAVDDGAAVLALRRALETRAP